MKVKKSATVQTMPQAPSPATWQAIVEALQLEIILGHLQPREHLAEDEIISRYQSSRYAVRRAFDELQSLGLAVRSENRGTRIRGYTDREVADLYDLRELLEMGAALRIVMPVSPGLIYELTRIQQLHDEKSRDGKFLELYSLNNDFHQTLFGACSNVLLAESISAHALQVQPIRMRFINDERRKREVSQEHWDMIAALENEDARALARICGLHLSRSKTVYLKSRPGVGDSPSVVRPHLPVQREASNDE